MGAELIQVIEQIGREKGIELETIISAVEDAIVTASRKNFKTSEDLVAHLDRDTGKQRELLDLAEPIMGAALMNDRALVLTTYPGAIVSVGLR